VPALSTIAESNEEADKDNDDNDNDEPMAPPPGPDKHHDDEDRKTGGTPPQAKKQASNDDSASTGAPSTATFGDGRYSSRTRRPDHGYTPSHANKTYGFTHLNVDSGYNTSPTLGYTKLIRPTNIRVYNHLSDNPFVLAISRTTVS
jgi:hypothetical protein